VPDENPLENELARRRDGLRRDLRGLRELPPAPPILVELWEILDSETSSARTVAETLAKDPALSAKILRFANSAYFGLARPVGDVAAACVVLGFDLIRNLAIGVTTLEALTRRVGAVLDADAFWRHSLATAAGARLVAGRIGLASPGTAFCAGILHDVGKLVLATVAAARYRRILKAPLEEAPGGGDGEAAGEGGPPPDPGVVRRRREVEEFGADHATVGEWLGEGWRFPPEILEAVRRHHDCAASDPPSRWGALVRVADDLARGAGHPSPPDRGPGHPEVAPEPEVLRAIGLSEAAYAELAAALPDELERLGVIAAPAGPVR
jgi:HD-like signal output (HDOD) protein